MGAAAFQLSRPALGLVLHARTAPVKSNPLAWRDGAEQETAPSLGRAAAAGSSRKGVSVSRCTRASSWRQGWLPPVGSSPPRPAPRVAGPRLVLSGQCTTARAHHKFTNQHPRLCEDPAPAPVAAGLAGLGHRPWPSRCCSDRPLLAAILALTPTPHQPPSLEVGGSTGVRSWGQG